MGSKKFKNKTCVYCRENTSETADHVFPREFFQIHERQNLPKVPACKNCNNKKSALEHYLTATLTFGATHRNSIDALSIDTAKRLSRNNKLFQEHRSNLSKHTYFDGTLVTTTSTLKLEPEYLTEFVAYVALGLLWHHWKIILPKGFSYQAFMPSTKGAEFVTNLFNLNSNMYIHESLGDETMRYKGIASEVDVGLSVWAIQLLGGMTLMDATKEI